MDTCSPPNSKFLFFSLFTCIFCSTATGFTNKNLNTIQHDFVNFPTTTPVTNPVTTPPTVVTVPSATPVTVAPTPPSAPITVPPTTNNPGGQPVTNPVTTPSVAPPVATNAPAVPGQSWCIAKTGVPEKSLQAALDYACGIGKADCSGIQQGAGCYNPNTLQNHASFAFNSYYQKNPLPTSCDFGGAAMVTTTNPSSGSCIFPISSSSSSTPTMASPTTPTSANPVPTPATPTSANPVPTPAPPIPTPTTASSTGAGAPTGSSSSGVPPTILNGSNPALGGATAGFGDSPPAVNMTSSVSLSRSLQPFITSFFVVTSVITGGIVFDI